MNAGLLLLLSRTSDPAIRTLQQQAPDRLVHATIRDLSSAGWRYESGRPQQASACAGGRVVPVERIAAVVCRIAAVVPSDLPHVHPEDRAYVADEMTAFVRAWLAQFTGVRFNQPTWASLAGPGWHPLQWTWLVGRLGVPVAATPSADVARSECETMTATVVHDEVFGFTDPTLIEYSLRIARAVHSELLAVTFVRDRGWAFLSAHPFPVLDAASAPALLRRAFRLTANPSITPDAGALCDVA
jgi:hypothetical protein